MQQNTITLKFVAIDGPYQYEVFVCVSAIRGVMQIIYYLFFDCRGYCFGDPNVCTNYTLAFWFKPGPDLESVTTTAQTGELLCSLLVRILPERYPIIVLQRLVWVASHYICIYIVTCQAHPVLVKSESNVQIVSFLNFCIGSHG